MRHPRSLQSLLALALIALTCIAGPGCSDDGTPVLDGAPVVDSEAPAPDAGAADTTAGDTGPWQNPGCTEAANVVDRGLRLRLEVDLSTWEKREYKVKERVTVRPAAAGQAISLYGTALVLGRASHGYAYNGQLATFCTGPFAAGDEVVVEIEYVISEAVQAFPKGSLAGMRVWGDPAGDFAVGPYASPFFASTWLLAPQSATWIDVEHDGNVALEAVELTVTTPGPTWTVVGPGSAPQTGSSASFALAQSLPLYALSFAASPRYEIVKAGASGVELAAGVFAKSKAAAATHLAAAGRALDWIGPRLAPYPFGPRLSYAEIPGFDGGMEHATAIWLGSPVLDGSSTGDYVAIHESVHHFWGNSVRFADWPHFWLSEGFTEWTTIFAALEPATDAQVARIAQRQYREKAAAASYPAKAGGPLPGPLRFADGGGIMDQVASNLLFFYYYGAAFLEMVHRRLVRDHGTDLLATLKAWYAAKQGQAVTTEEFRDFLGARTGDQQKWKTLFEQWVTTGPCPTLELRNYSFADGQAQVELKRIGGANQDLLQLEVAFVVGGAPKVATVSLPAGTDSAVASVAATTAPTHIAVDPDGFYILRLVTLPPWGGPPYGNSLP